MHYWDRGDPEPIAVFDHGVLAGDTRYPHALQCDRLKLRRAADDPVLAREFLIRASLISSVREAAEIG